MNIEKQILELCEEVVGNGSANEVNCDGIWCGNCPLSRENRKDGIRCGKDDEATVKIAKEYIDKNKTHWKVKEIVKNIIKNLVGSFIN